MNRKIQFRAWDKKNKKMYKRAGISPHNDLQYAVKQEGGGSRYFNFDDLHIEQDSIYYPDDIILMQYTGLKDKNGEEVYEGDVLKWDDTEETGYVEYMEETTEYVVDEWKEGNKRSKGHSLSSVDEVEIIGNIYQNPELIKR